MTLDGPLHSWLYVPHIYKHEKPGGRSAAARLAAFRSLPAVASLTGCKPEKLTIFRSQRLVASYLRRAVTSQPGNRPKIRNLRIGSNTSEFMELSASPDRRENLKVP